jgi:hypothetical protein
VVVVPTRRGMELVLLHHLHDIKSKLVVRDHLKACLHQHLGLLSVVLGVRDESPLELTTPGRVCVFGAHPLVLACYRTGTLACVH